MQARQLHLDFVPVYVFLSGSRKILSRIHFVNNGFKSQGHAFAWLFYYQVPQESSSTRFVVKSIPTGLTLFKHSAIRNHGGEAMTKMSTIYSRLSYGTGTALTGCGVSAKAYADVAKTEVWILADKVAGMSLSDWAIVVGIACTVITCGVNWYYRRKEREDRLNGYVTKAEE